MRHIRIFSAVMLLLHGVAFHGFAQDQHFIDSLEQAIRQPESDAALAANLNHLAWQYMRIDPEKGIEYCERALEISTGMKDSAGVSKATIILGTLNMMVGDVDRALKHYHNALAIREAQGDRLGVAAVWNNIGNVYLYQGRLREATEYLINALNIYHELGLAAEIASSAGNLGNVFSTMHEWNEAQKYYLQNVEYARENRDSTGIAMGLSNVGLAYGRLGEDEKALAAFREGEAIFRALRNRSDIGLLLTGYGALLHSRGEDERSLALLKEAEEVNRETGNRTSLGATVRLLASSYADRGDISTAKKYAQEGEDLAREAQSGVDLRNAYESWAVVYEAAGQFQEALKYTRMEQSLSDSLLNERTTEQIAEMQARYETTKKELEIERLTQAEQIALLESEQANLTLAQRNAQLIGVGLGLVLLVGFALFFFYRSRQKQQAALQAAVIREQELGLKAVIQAQEEERKRIAKDLHDGIGQQLSGLKLAWSGLSRDMEKPQLQERLDGLTRVLDDSCTDVRNLSHQMMPRALRESGVAPAISDMLEKSFGHTEISCEFDTFGADGRYSEDIELTLYRVSQELVNNIMKHAGASKVHVNLLKNRDNLVLLIEDNGRGFDVEKASAGGMGMLNISTRLKNVAGSISYDRGAEGGTVATVRVPVVELKQSA